MDKTIEIMLVAVVAIIVAVIAVTLAQGQASEVDDFLGGQKDSAECSLFKQRGEIQQARELEGCTVTDSDGDGTIDARDRCPENPEAVSPPCQTSGSQTGDSNR